MPSLPQDKARSRLPEVHRHARHAGECVQSVPVALEEGFEGCAPGPGALRCFSWAVNVPIRRGLADVACMLVQKPQRCCECGDTKGPDHFRHLKSRPSGLDSTCHDCRAEARVGQPCVEVRRAPAQVPSVPTAGCQSRQRGGMHAQEPAVDRKVCSMCGCELGQRQFSRSVRALDGLLGYCKSCESVYKHWLRQQVGVRANQTLLISA